MNLIQNDFVVHEKRIGQYKRIEPVTVMGAKGTLFNIKVKINF